MSRKRMQIMEDGVFVETKFSLRLQIYTDENTLDELLILKV